MALPAPARPSNALVLNSDWARRLRPLADVVAGALILLAVVWLNGRPVVFADTNIYNWMGQMQYRPVRYALSPLIGGPSKASEDPDAADEAPSELHLRRTEMAARSPWFGMILYAFAGLGDLWRFAALQAIAASFAVHALWRAASPRRSFANWIVLIGGVTVTSTLPFFVGFAMPDLWGGTGLVALATLLIYGRRVGRWTTAGLSLLVLASLLFHQSNMLVAFPTLALISVIAVKRLNWPVQSIRRGWTVLAAAMLITLAMNSGYVGAIRTATGETLRSPPFIAARLLADGPGRRYLKSSCAKGGTWTLCRFAKLPLTDSQDILWSGDPKKGVFGRAAAEQRIAIDREQISFALHVIAFDPLGVIAAATRNALQELVSVQLDDPLRDPHYYLTDGDWKDTFIADMVHRIADCGPAETLCRPRWNEGQSAIWHGGWFVATVLFVGVMICRKNRQSSRSRTRLFLLAGLFGVALILNAAVTGALSGPFPRYQARLAWLAPLAAGLILSSIRRPSKAFGRDAHSV